MSRRPDWLVSPDSHASPTTPRDPANVRWYLPTWGERLRLMGWRNVAWLLPLAMLALVGLLLWNHLFTVGSTFAFWKLAVFLFAVPISIATKQTAAALKDRRDPFCIHCGYSLTGLADGQPCPECGEVTSHATCREYQRDPQAFIERYKSVGSMPTADAPFEITTKHDPCRGDGT